MMIYNDRTQNLWYLLTNADGQEHRIWAVDLDAASQRAHELTRKGAIYESDTWVCTKHRNEFFWDKIAGRWDRYDKYKKQSDIPVNANKKIQKFKDGHERRCLHRS